MLHECCRWTSRDPRDLAVGTDRISVQRAGDPLQPAEDRRGFLEPTPAWRRRLCLHGGDGRILPLNLTRKVDKIGLRKGRNEKGETDQGRPISRSSRRLGLDI